MATLLHLSINFSALSSTPHDDSGKKHTNCSSKSSQPIKKIGSFYFFGDSNDKDSFHGLKFLQPSSYHPHSKPNSGSLCRNRFKSGALKGEWSFLELRRNKNEILVGGERWRRKKRVVLVRFNEGFGFNSGGGGGGGQDNSNNVRVLGNLVLAIILTYFTMTGQLGWFLDAVVSIWLLAVLVPIVGLGAFIWWAGRDIVQSSCPNCGNDFQVFRSMLNDDVQLCPYCSQPFSVVGDEFVRDPVMFANQTTTFGQAFDDFSRSNKGKDSSVGVVDVEAEIRDVD